MFQYIRTRFNIRLDVNQKPTLDIICLHLMFSIALYTLKPTETYTVALVPLNMVYSNLFLVV